jgi:outer membrane PBP1 activator LpoA protein|tara:strand:- start:539 stop:937 length:399 start_codon:yes stop_codon:yes gene_type:complete
MSDVQDQLKSQSDMSEYQKDFLEMNIGALTSIMRNAQDIISSMADEKVKKNLTESWLQGKIAVTEDYMSTIHDFVKYSPADDDKEDMAPASLWENIRKKKLREGKNYRPAKPGDKDRPTPEALKRAQKKSKK